jgi:hypothetical protein
MSDQSMPAGSWNRSTAIAVKRIRDELLLTQQQCASLREANANLVVERDAADVLLGAAMDQLLERGCS